MPTNFPTSVDNFTNPTANDSLNLPSHSTQHANANDAIEAIEDYLLNGQAWTAWTPTITATSGSITAYTINQARYVKIGKTVILNLFFTITNNGTGAGNISFTLPITARSTFAGSGAGRENGVTGNGLAVFNSATTSATISTYNNGYPGGNNYSPGIVFTYEAA